MILSDYSLAAPVHNVEHSLVAIRLLLLLFYNSLRGCQLVKFTGIFDGFFCGVVRQHLIIIQIDPIQLVDIGFAIQMPLLYVGDLFALVCR